MKADAKKDYYADLELPSSADEDQIKKQFRLLARQYHPDKNPGHEVECLSKFQAVQAAHEILSDPIEKTKYDTARQKLNHRPTSSVPPPPRDTRDPRDDPYGFKRPTRAQTTHFGPPPPQQAKPKPKPTPQPGYATPRQGPAPSPGAEKLGAFARGAQGQRWDRAAWEEASRNEGMRGFQRMPAGGPAPQMPPRPPRQAPTAPRPPSTTGPSPDIPNGANLGFPGLSRTNSARRMHYPDEKQAPRSAYGYVRADRPPPTTNSYDAYTPQSPPMSRAQATASPLRHSRSTEQTHSQRPGMGERQTSRYASNSGEKTNMYEGLGRSASVRNSPIDRTFEEDSGPFGRPHSHHFTSQPQEHTRPRHRSASPALRKSPYSNPEDTSSDDDDGPVHMASAQDRPKQTPRSRRQPKSDGADAFFPSSNYTRVVDDDDPSNTYRYPPPPSKAPTRHPFPDMTSPVEPQAEPRNFSTSTATTERPPADPVFQPAKFQHEDWAERLRQERNVSPSKQQRGSKSNSKRPTVSTSNSGDAMEVDPSPADTSKPRTNGSLNLDDLKDSAPFTSEGGLNGVSDDLKSHLPFESRPAAFPDLDKSSATHSRLRYRDLPRPPKLVHPPGPDCLDRENWVEYTESIKKYLVDWANYEERMIDHFHTRNRLVRTAMAENWVTNVSDGPHGDQIDDSDGADPEKGVKAGFGTYMEWLEDDQLCHTAWSTACDRHRGCMDELGKCRERIKKMGNGDS